MKATGLAAAPRVGQAVRVTRFASYDGTMLSYRGTASGPVVVCLPGGPARNPVYLGDLGGLGAASGRDLVMLETRGTGESAVPADNTTYRCDRQVGDVEALRMHLGLDRLDLLAHSAGANLAVLYAARYPDRIRRLVLLAPGLYALGLAPPPAAVLAAALARRSAEPWYAEARDAFLAAQAGRDSVASLRRYAPLYYRRWNETTRAHADLGLEPRAALIAARYYRRAFDPAATVAALARLTAPVLVYAGELDVIPPAAQAARAVGCFPDAEFAVHPGASHMPWVDDPAWLTARIARFLA